MSDSEDKKPPKGPTGKCPGRTGGEVGDALRKVYDRTLNESIPPAMLDLLGRLD